MKQLKSNFALIIIALAVGLILAFPVMWLWNWALVPAVTIVAPITYLQAYGLMILFTILQASRRK